MSANRIGFMQGRLSPLVNGRIQAFPWDDWRDEFQLANKSGFQNIEWTLDQENLYKNPLMFSEGQNEVRALCKSFNISIPSLTGDCFMQAPFWKTTGGEKEKLENDFIEIVKASSQVGIQMVVVPLVDNGRLENDNQETKLVEFLNLQCELLSDNAIRIIFESDFEPANLARFIDQLDPKYFGVNYDVGNSAALGYKPSEEFQAYGSRIVNVHIKDRIYNGTTVPLGEGDADFDSVFSGLSKIRYSGNYILQTARATNNDHAGVLRRYRDMTENWIAKYAA